MEDKTIGELTEEERKAFLAALEKESPGAVENIRMLVDLFSAFKRVFSELKGVLSELKGVLSDPAAYDGIPVASDEEMQPLRELSTDTFMDSMVSLAESDKSKYERVMARLMFDLFTGERSKTQGFYLLAQNKPSNALAKMLTQRIGDPAQLDIYGSGSIVEKDFKLFIKGYSELVSGGVKQSAAMLLDSLMITATENGLQDTLICLPLKKYMEMRGLSDEKATRAQVKGDINALERIHFEYKGTGKQRGAWLKVSISGGTVGQIKNGDILFRFNQDFFNSFKTGSGNKFLYMYFPREALQGNTRANPWKYWLGRKISEHKRINIGKANADIISVKTLIDACPNYPTYDAVMNSDRHIDTRIIQPFERDLDALSPSIKWNYQGLTESPTDYQTFIDANIVIQWAYYPDTSKLAAGKKKRARKQQADKAKKTQTEW